MFKYSDLINDRQDSFYLSIIVAKFLRIKMHESKLLIQTLKEMEDEQFINTLIQHYHYIQKPIDVKGIIKSHIGMLKIIFKIYLVILI